MLYKDFSTEILGLQGGIVVLSQLVWLGVVLSAVFCVLSKVLSGQYALLLGRE